MLPDFEKSILGLKTGEQRRFDLNFPNDYHGKDVAGRTAKFDITLKKLEVVNLPEVDIEFSKSLGIKDGDLCKMRAEIKINLEREVDSHVARRNKETVLSMLLEVSSLEVPNTLCEREIERLTEITRQEMTRRGMEVDENLLTPDMLRPKADRRVRLGLILAKIASENELNATEGQIRSKVESLSEGYENPEEIVKSYFKSQHRLADVESLVVEENVINYVLNKSKVVEKLVPFDELMNRVRV
jgi:trigger factor